MKTLQKHFKSTKMVFTLLVLNTIFAIVHTGDMLIEGNYSFLIDGSLLISLFYTLTLPITAYVVHRFLSKRVAENIIKNNPSIEKKIKILKDEFNTTK